MAWGEVAAAAIPTALNLAGTGARAKGQSQQGTSNAALSGYQAEVARRNAKVEEMRATRAEQAGISGSDVESLRGANVLGAVKARQGASNVDVNSGSNVNVRAGIAQANKFSAENVLNNALLTAYGYRRQGENETAQAGIYDAAAAGALRGSDIGAGATLLEGASQLPFGWLKGLGTGGDNSGLPSQSELDALSAQAAGDIAGGAVV